MSFAAALSEEKQKASKGPACVFVSIFATSPDADQIRAALADEVSTPGTHISRALAGIGFNVSATTVQRHRKGECHCPRSA